MVLMIRELAILISAAVIAWPYCRVLSRAGFSPRLGLLVFVPIVNIMALWLFAYAKCPALCKPSLRHDQTLLPPV